MGKKTVITCDDCGKAQGEGAQSDGVFFEIVLQRARFSLGPSVTHHACSLQCEARLLRKLADGVDAENAKP